MSNQNSAVGHAQRPAPPNPMFAAGPSNEVGMGFPHIELPAAQAQPQAFSQPQAVAPPADAFQRGPRLGRSPRLPRGCATGMRHAAAFAVGGGITALTTYFLVKSVQSHIHNASVSNDPAVWTGKVKQDYADCYNGCNDCSDTSFAYNACQRTAKIVAAGVNCDGSAMWNWAQRVPDACVQAQAVVYKAQALSHAKQNERDKLALIILTVVAGVVGYLVTYKLAGCLGARMGSAAGARQAPREEA